MGGDGRHAYLRSIAGGAALVAAILPTTATAAGRAPVFDVPAQPLASALRELARQGRVQILFPAERLEGRRSRAVVGRIEVTHAFDLALSDAGFEARRVDARTFVIVARSRRAIAPPYPPPTAELDPILVTARRPDPNEIERRLAGDLEAATAVRSLSRDDMERGAAQNLSEALGDLPGMTVINTGRSFIGGIDSASRGEGLYAAYRGLNAEYNLSMINGVSVAQGLPYSRGVQLNLLPPDAFQTVVVHKTGRADFDGDFIGAALDFQTPGPADLSRTPWTAVSVGGRVETRARDYGDAVWARISASSTVAASAPRISWASISPPPTRIASSSIRNWPASWRPRTTGVGPMGCQVRRRADRSIPRGRRTTWSRPV